MARPVIARELVLRTSPAWRLFLEEGRAVLTAGADETYLLDELSPDEADELHRGWASGAVSLDDAGRTPALRDAIGLLEKSGALFVGDAAVESGARLRWSIVAIGDCAVPIAELVRTMASRDDGLTHVERDDAPALVILVRGNGPLLGVLDEAGAAAALPHLLVDVGYAHTLSIGPFVWPGRTACIGCFAGRIAHAWGDAEPPRAPRASRAAELAAAMVLERLRSFRAHRGCAFLVERVVSLDLSTLETRTDHVFRLPWCPRCQSPADDRRGTGSFALPWLPKAAP